MLQVRAAEEEEEEEEEYILPHGRITRDAIRC
jgi:hypothetical protein